MSTLESPPEIPAFAPRESGCPVHFLWDGSGRGRPFVRAGFMGLLVAGALATAAIMRVPGLPDLREAASWTATLSGVAWALGQVLRLVRR